MFWLGGKRRKYVWWTVLASAAALSIFLAPAWAAMGTYVVQKGDTLYSIAKAHGVSVDQLALWNDIKDPAKLQPGMTLKLSAPPSTAAAAPAGKQAAADIGKANAGASTQQSTTYAVQKGDTLWAISRKTGIAVQDIMKFNNLREETILQVGYVLHLTGQTVPVAEQGSPAGTAPAGQIRLVKVEPPDMPEPVNPTTALPAASLSQVKTGISLAWPVTGRLTSGFGNRGKSRHDGIDLGVPVGTPVRAAADGVVRYAGFYGDYGRLVIIDHGDGWETYYAHNSQLLVNAGDQVHRSQVIAKSGSSGRTTGPHVHFEVRHNGTPLDPLRYL